jgi:hypothetical protein
MVPVHKLISTHTLGLLSSAAARLRHMLELKHTNLPVFGCTMSALIALQKAWNIDLLLWSSDALCRGRCAVIQLIDDSIMSDSPCRRAQGCAQQFCMRSLRGRGRSQTGVPDRGGNKLPCLSFPLRDQLYHVEKVVAWLMELSAWKHSQVEPQPRHSRRLHQPS